jgi:hypothetical protein
MKREEEKRIEGVTDGLTTEDWSGDKELQMRLVFSNLVA